MKLLNSVQIKQWDQYTILQEPIPSAQLMERAAKACTRWILQNILAENFYIFCGKGNNGGDGLAIARLLHSAGNKCKVFITNLEATGSEDFNFNFDYLHKLQSVPITVLKTEADFPPLPPHTVIIDALFGTGLNRKLDTENALLVNYINNSGNTIISIDVPSGLLSDNSSAENIVIKANHTLTFQCMKLAFLLAENEPYLGQVHILDINLHPDFLDTIETRFQLINKIKCQSVLKVRKPFSHKGNFGHALLIAGSYEKMGAAVLSAKACMKSGVGLLTCHIPKCGVAVLQTSVPEAMCIADAKEESVSELPNELSKYNAIGIGPGIGTSEAAIFLLKNLIEKIQQPLVLDADALNLLARRKELLRRLPENSILTPHPKEFARLFGEHLNDFQKIETAIEKAVALKIVIVLKGHYTFIAMPSGEGYFNITGNAGMATGGSGDVLTGIITGLLAQHYAPVDAAIAGVFLHGLAGDLAADVHSMEAMTASNIIDFMGKAFKEIRD
jgi:NAD(P)H-hydrate epimerase